jgi:hypothetical protein
MITKFKIFESGQLDVKSYDLRDILEEYLINPEEGIDATVDNDRFEERLNGMFKGKFCSFESEDDEELVEGIVEDFEVISYYCYEINIYITVDGVKYDLRNDDWLIKTYLKDSKDIEEYKRKREEIRLKMLDIDPYSEERWELESYHAADLTPHYHSHSRGYHRVFNIGWLDTDKPFEKGEVPESFLRRLSGADTVHYLDRSYTCPFCGKEKGNNIIVVEGHGKTYFAPQMLFHYITAHHYKPPEEFIDAVMEYPDKENPKKRFRRSDDFSWA